jgi:DNA-binding transcriptional MerR regulator
MADSTTVLAFSAEHMERLTGLTPRQLAYWDKTDFFKPEYASENRRLPNSRVYSFKDAVGLRTISVLLNAHKVSLPHLKDVARKLATYTNRPWSELRLRVWNRRVQFDEPETGATRSNHLIC